MTIGYGVCTGSWDRLQANVIPRIGQSPLCALSGQTSIAVAYNSILDVYEGHNLDAVVLLHDDLEITDPAREAKILEVMSRPTASVVGVAGAWGVTGLAWWNANPVGHQVAGNTVLDFGLREGYVNALEGSFLAFSPWAVKNLRLDESYPGFHGYDCDIGMQATAAGRMPMVIDLDTHHHGTGRLGFRSQESHEEWLRADVIFREKWGL